MLIQAPDNTNLASKDVRIFLAGGITNCPVWQDEIVKVINTDEYDVINPRRRENFENYGDIAAEQIAWEHDAFTKINVSLFWFPYETLCPITLFELGKQLSYVGQNDVARYLIVGWHDEYKRAFDLEQQIKLDIASNPNIRHSILYYAPGWDNFVNTVKQYYG